MFQAGADSFSWSKSIWSDLGKCCRLAQTLPWKITRAGLQVLLLNDLVFHLSIIKVWWQRPTNTCLWLTASIVPGKKCSRSQQVMKQETKKQSHLFTCLDLPCIGTGMLQPIFISHLPNVKFCFSLDKHVMGNSFWHLKLPTGKSTDRNFPPSTWSSLKLARRYWQC